MIRLHKAGLGLLLLLGACAGPVANEAFNDVAKETEQRIGKRPVWIRSDADERAVRETLDALLAKPLSADDAVQVALLNNRRLQRSFADLGIGAADLTASWRPANPGVSFARLTRGNETEIDRRIGIDALGLLALPITAGIEGRRFEQNRLQTATDVLALAAKTKRAWYEAVAAQQAAVYMAQIRDSADTEAELAQRMRAVGNWGVLEDARAKLFSAEMTARLARSRLAATVARERLGRLMGLWGTDMAYRLPDRLPALPKDPRDMPAIETAAIRDRLDVRMAQADLEATRKAAGLTTATRFINVLELGYNRNSETGRPRQTGYDISLEIPLFDFGDAKSSKAEFAYMAAASRLSEAAVNARSAARESYIGYRTAYDLAQHYQGRILPLRKQIGEEMGLRYNGMLASVFTLLADAREQVAEVSAGLEAQRDFWLADTDLTYVTLAPVEP